MKVRTIGTNTINDHRAVFIRVSKKSWFCIYYATPLAEKKLARSFHLIKSKTKTNPTSLAHVFPRLASATLLITCFDWFIGLSLVFVID